MRYYSCMVCHKEMPVCNYAIHKNAKKQCKIFTKLIKENELECTYCNKICKTIQGRHNHEWQCKLNPQGKIKTMPEAWNKGLTVETNNSVKQALDTRTARIDSGDLILGGWTWSDEQRQEHSIIMAAVAESTPNSYSGRFNRGHVKEIICRNGFKVLGSWEELFVHYCVDNNISIEQPTKSFTYVFENKLHSYYPDFYLPEYDFYVEVKGYEKDRDRSKWNSLINTHLKKLIVVKSTEINLIKKNLYNLLDYI